MIITVDTNILVSAMLTPGGTCDNLAKALLTFRLRLVVDNRIFSEYANVLSRQRFNFNPETVHSLLNHIAAESLFIYPRKLDVRLPDPDDLAFLEVASETESKILVTGNRRDFPAKLVRGIHVMEPSRFVREHL